MTQETQPKAKAGLGKTRISDVLSASGFRESVNEDYVPYVDAASSSDIAVTSRGLQQLVVFFF